MSHLSGIIYPSAFQVTELVKTMQSVFNGSNKFDYYRHKNVELGSWGTPLATNERKNTWALIDGNLYNSKRLREDLHKISGFSSHLMTDAEIVVHAYDTWGDECLSHLAGPFVVAIFDEEKQQLLVARDRLGQKPLYWVPQGEYWLFSTQIKGLLSTGIVPQTPSRDAIASYLYFGYIPQDLSPIQGVNKLLPGHFLKVNLSRQVLIGQYWSYSRLLNEKRPCSASGFYDEIGHYLEEAVSQSLPENDRVTGALKGNLGSSVLGWFASHQRPRNQIHTSTAVFEEPESPEVTTASALAKELAITHETHTISPAQVLADLPKVVWYLDEPLADPYVMRTWELGKMSRATGRSLMIDAGWEELFAGNSRYYNPNGKGSSPPLAFYLAKSSPKMRHHFILPFLHIIRMRLKYRILRNIDIDREQVHYLMDTALFKGKSRKKASPFLYPAFDPEVFTQRFHQLSSLPGDITPLLYYDIKTRLPDNQLIQYERLLAPHGVRPIAPYLDHRLVEFLAHIPEAIKFEKKAPAGILHNLMQHLCHECPPFPEREGSFLDHWCHNEQFRQLFRHLEKGHLVAERWISPKWIRQQLGYPYLIPRTFHQLWSLLVLELWFAQYIARPIDPNTCNLSIDELISTT